MENSITENGSATGKALVRANLEILNRSRFVNPLLVSLLQPESIEAESYLNLRHSLEKLRGAKESIVVAMTSPVQGEGKTMTSINLAGSLARNSGNKGLLIDLDLRQVKHDILTYLGVKGLSERGVVDNIFNSDSNWERASCYINDFNLYVMPAGRHSSSPYEVLNSELLGELINNARQYFQYVIIDTPPILALPDSHLISKWIDGFMVLVTSGITTKKMLAEALDLMEPEKVLGMVFNRNPVKRSGYTLY